MMSNLIHKPLVLFNRKSNYVPLQYSIISLRARTDIRAFMWVSQVIWGTAILKKNNAIRESELDPWTLFLNAMRAPMTRDRYQTRVAKFFSFVGTPGKTRAKSQNFCQ
jgi:hypothetical protein